jgi:hypothetical protein
MSLNAKLIYFYILVLLILSLNKALSQENQIRNHNNPKKVTLTDTYRTILTKNTLLASNKTNMVKVTHIYHRIILAKNHESVLKADTKMNPNLTSYPVPAIDNVILSITSNYDCNANINLYSIEGKIVLSKKVMLKSGLNKFDFDLTAIEQGIYCFIVNSGNNCSFLKLLKVR